MEELVKNNSDLINNEYRGMLQRLIEIGMNTNNRVNNIEQDLSKVKDRVDNIEYHEEITYEQQNMINTLISKRVYAVLDLNPSPSKWTEEEQLIYAKYGRMFRRRLRSEVSNKGHLAYPFRTTSKGNYDSACRDIMAWIPRNGTNELKKEADERAKANRLAKEQGYV